MLRFLKLVALVFLSTTAFGATTINVSGTVAVPGVKRFGLNLGWATYYDSGQIMKNLVFRNPGFEGLISRSIVRVVSGSATGFIDENPSAHWTTGFWNGASFEVIVGGAKGRSGTISTSTAPAGGNGTQFVFSSSGVAPAAGDYVLLRKVESGGSTAGWFPTVAGGGAVTDETADLAPDTQGHQAVRVSANGSGQSARIAGAFDTSVAGPFVQLNGSFRLTFKAKGAGGSNALAVFLGRGAPANLVFINQTVNLTGAWSTYNLDFAATEGGTSRGAVGLNFIAPNASAVLLDDVSLTQINGDPTNTTAFRDPVVNALKTFNPGILRYWVEDLGDSLDNEIAPPLARRRANYSSRILLREDIMYGLHEFLELCDLVHAEPWYIVPATFTNAEMTNLIEYLGGPVSTPYGAMRASRGRSAPWSDAFTTIHLEFGNEAWNNADYYGATISDPASYGARGSELFGVGKTSPYYSAKYDLVLGSQAAVPARSAAIHNASANHSSLAVAPYFGGNIESFNTNEELFGPLFAEPEQITQTGYMRQSANNMLASSRPVPLSIYEVNLHTTNGSITQPVLDSFTPSVGAGVAVADHMLQMLRDLSIRNQCLYSLTQLAFNRTDGKYVLLWSVVRDMGVTDRKRPQYLAVQMANEVLGGDLVQTTQTGDNPTWNQPLVNGIQYNNAHLIQSFGFVNGTKRAVIVFNLDRVNPLQVTIAGANAPHGAVTIRQLTSSSITNTNENAQNVSSSTQTVASFDPAQALTLPPFSMSVLSSDEGAAPLRIKGDLNGNGSVSAFDASIVLQAVVGAVSLDTHQQCAGDYNSNGAVSAFDAALILQCVVGGSCSSGTCN
jgi:alpha-L-arabinofuranosidase